MYYLCDYHTVKSTESRVKVWKIIYPESPNYFYILTCLWLSHLVQLHPCWLYIHLLNSPADAEKSLEQEEPNMQKYITSAPSFANLVEGRYV